MKLLLLLLPAVLALREDLHYGSQELVDYINDLDTTWTAGFNPRFDGVDHEVIKGMLGLRLKPRQGPVKLGKSRKLNVKIPDNFDSRQQWPNCPSLREVRDQSACGSCWAFGAAEAMSDRVCIASNGKVKVHLSTDDLLSCCTACGYGCEGGDPLSAWEFWVSHGLVTGGNFTSKSGCRPYPFPPCEHHSNRTHYRPCKHDLYPTPQCKRQCQSSYHKAYDTDKHFGRKAYAIDGTVESIQKEVMTNGPVEAAFTVYEDFLHYTDGVYQHHAGKIDGGHAVKIVGWGKDGNTPYWLVANSWNSDWGIGGFFKILRGQDECGIESECVAGTPKFNWTVRPKKHKKQQIVF